MNLTQEDWVSNLEADANVILDVRTEDECNDGIIATINIDIHKGSVLFLKLKVREE
jgi:hypothetical protein